MIVPDCSKFVKKIIKKLLIKKFFQGQAYDLKDLKNLSTSAVKNLCQKV